MYLFARKFYYCHFGRVYRFKYCTTYVSLLSPNITNLVVLRGEKLVGLNKENCNNSFPPMVTDRKGRDRKDGTGSLGDKMSESNCILQILVSAPPRHS